MLSAPCRRRTRLSSFWAAASPSAQWAVCVAAFICASSDKKIVAALGAGRPGQENGHKEKSGEQAGAAHAKTPSRASKCISDRIRAPAAPVDGGKSRQPGHEMSHETTQESNSPQP
jgi:hypothetical protein